MKQFYFTLLFLSLSLFVSAQVSEGKPVKDITFIKRADDNTQTAKSTSISKTSITAKSFSTATTPTGSSSEVGTTEGQLTVSLNGAANYSIPIAVPAGINGVQPQISLDYNSQRGLKGTAALGWDIGGISKIKRIPSTSIHDGIIDGVDFNRLDRFELDGQRLIVKSGSGGYGRHRTVYETEYFSNIKITSYGSSPLGPTYFTVEYPDGSKAVYGNSEDVGSRAEWAITYWENPQGARINYSYNISNNTLYIASIKYGALTTSTPINEIQFLYGPRSTIEMEYSNLLGPVLRDKILTDIKVLGSGLGFRNYVIDSPNKNQIKSITEKSGDNSKSYNPTVFEYASTNNNTSVSYLSKDTQLDVGNIDSRNSATVTGDFDEDGKMDLLLYPIYGSNANKEYFLYTNIESGLNIGAKHPVGAFEDIFATRWLSGNNKVMPQGWTVVTKSMANTTAPTDYKFTVYSIGYTTPIYEQYSKNIQFPADMINTKCWSANSCSKTTTYKIFDKKIISGDFNGDGLTDVIAININTIKETCKKQSNITSICEQITETVTSKKVYFIDLKRDLTDYFFEAGELAAAITKDSKVEIADFNGDGKSDFFIFDNGSVRIYTLNEANTVTLLHEITGDSAISLTKPILIGDYNGDSKYEFVIPKTFNSSYWFKYTSTGINLIKEEKLFKPPYYANTPYDTYDFVASDYNNDGLTDLIYIQSTRSNTDNSLGRVNVGCYGNTNGDITDSATWANSGFVPGINIYALPIYLPQSNKNLNNNVNQISSTLEVAFLNKNKLHFFSSVYDYTKGNLLTKITTGSGVQESIEYVPLDPRYQDDYYNHSIYLPSRTALYPNMDVQINPSFFVVSKIQKQSKDVYKKKLFNYYGAVYNHEGLGFLGFRSVTQTNWHDDSTPIFSSVTKNNIDLRGTSTENFTIADMYYPGDGPIPSNFVSKSITTYNTPVDALQSNKVFKLQMTNAKQFNGLENTTTEIKDIVYDSNNNVTSSTKILSDGTDTHTTINTVSYESPKASPYIVGRPLVNTESVSVSGNTMTSKKTYTYSDKELLSRTESQGNGSGIIYEDNEYDVFGNIVKKTITAPNLTPRETAFEYESTGRFVTKITDPEKLVTTFVNNPDGTLKSVTNPYSLTTSYTYDPWFKKLTVKDDNLNKTITYNYSKNAEKTVVTTTTDILDGSASEETFDDLGRKIKSGGKDLNGNFSYTSYLYDIYDRNYMVSEPYFGSSPTQWNETKFDIYNRPIENISFNTRTTNNQYTPNSLISKFIDGQKIKTATRNAMGNIVSMNETTGGTINYSYFANGNLKQIDYNNVKIDIEQDEWGRKSKITDPAAGIFEYKNNALGELTEETSQNGAVKTIITRDDTGKPIKKTVTGPGTDTETTYSYDNTTKLIIRSVFIDNTEPAGSNKITTTYNYDDNFKRIQNIIEYKENVSKFTTSFTYDGLGRISTETKKAELGGKISEITTTNVYKNGELYQIKDNTGKVLWQTNTLNPQGQILESILGNGIKMTNEYDNNGYLKKVIHDKTSTPQSNIITLTTEFDYKTDNLDSRVNSAFSNYTETFKYDEIARLREFTNKLGVNEIQNYEASGKIKDNNLGIYNYDVAKPYQNNSITLTPEATGYYANREGIYNDSMESRSGWSRDMHNPQCISFDDSKAHTGKNSVKINSALAPDHISYVQSNLSIPINNVDDTEYTFSGWVYTDNPLAQLTLFQYNANETGYYSYVNSVNTTSLNNWTQIQMTVLVPASVKSLRLRLDAVGNGNVWFDDVQIRKTNNAPTAERKLNITYNAFKSPIQIEETGVDKISFSYNDENQRSTMYYGSLEDKALRTLRKHYSADGSMEVKQNITTGAIEFVTYIAGDGYGAPIAVKSDGINPSQYLYLHRDYQGTILAITDANAAVVEKRLFDAWGSIIKVQDGAGNALTGLTVLDRGYTGHEHLQSVGLINMNARLYDPMLHRFLGIDNYIQDITSTQNFNNYGYVLNNPLLYIDPSGNMTQGSGGPGKDCFDCGWGSAIGSGITTIGQNWDNWRIKDWANKNINGHNISEWWKSKISFKNLFGGGNSGPPPNVSKPVNMNITRTQQNIQKINTKMYYDALDGIQFNDGSTKHRNDFVLTFNPSTSGNAEYLGFKGGKYHINFDISDFEITKSNIRALTIHEAYGHGDMNYGDRYNNHYKAYTATIDSKYWKSTTWEFKHNAVYKMWAYFYKEVGNKRMQEKYMIEYQKYIKRP